MNEQNHPESSGLSRRDFVRVSAVAAAVPVLSNGLASPLVHAAGSDTIKIGLIGCGGRGTGAATQALAADKGLVLWSMGDVFKDRLDAAHKNIGDWLGNTDDHPKDRTITKEQLNVADDRKFVGFDSYQKVIDSGVDAVLLTSYPCFRPEHLRAAIKAGKHVFAEKPIAVDAPGYRAFCAAGEEAKAKNLAVLIGFCWRHHPGMKAAFDKILSGSLGPVNSAYTTYLTGTLGKRPRQPEWTDVEFQMRNWWHFTWISGDHVVEQAVHSIDRLCWAMGDEMPKKISCLGGRAARVGPESGNVFDHFAAIYEYADGRRAYHGCRQIEGCSNDNSDYIYGSKGQAIVEGWGPTLKASDYSGKELWNIKGSSADVGAMYQNEHDELWASIRAGKPINDAQRSANSCMLAIASRMAAYTGKTITWDEAINSKEELVPAKLEFGPMETPAIAIPGKTKMM